MHGQQQKPILSIKEEMDRAWRDKCFRPIHICKWGEMVLPTLDGDPPQGWRYGRLYYFGNRQSKASRELGKKR
jgi:hypothetical protein